MNKNIVICCDGSGQKLQSTTTNVVRLFEALDRDDPRQQICCYDPGVGTLPHPTALNPVAKQLSVIGGLALGYGLIDKLANLYDFLIQHYSVGDQIYLFGFSRGAFTARALAGLLCRCGVLKQEHRNLIPYALEIYKPHYEGIKGKRERKDQIDRDNKFRELFSQPIDDIPFLGLWDTVKSYGYLWPVGLPNTRHNPLVNTVRHALSLDERRSFFTPTSWGGLDDPEDPKIENQNVKEVWFPGYHSDVGGGPVDSESGLARISLRWMLDEADKAGLLLNEDMRKAVLPDEPTSQSERDEWFCRHPSHIGFWRLGDFVPRRELKNVPPPPKPMPTWKSGKRDINTFKRDNKVLVHASALKHPPKNGIPYKFDSEFVQIEPESSGPENREPAGQSIV